MLPAEVTLDQWPDHSPCATATVGESDHVGFHVVHDRSPAVTVDP
jgi:hypothetical protein